MESNLRTNMEVLQKRVKMLNSSIFDLINKFEGETGLSVNTVDITHEPIMRIESMGEVTISTRPPLMMVDASIFLQQKV